jgi:hypothetical protein
MTKIDLVRKVRGLSSYQNVVDNSFSELITPVQSAVVEDITVEKFFEYYDQLLYDSPANGELNSHEYLVFRSTQYLGGSIFDAEKAALVEEINSLRQQLLDLGDTYLTIGNITK